MNLNSFLKSCLEKVNLNPELVLTQCDPSTISYIQPFSLISTENPIVGYIHVSVINFLYFI